MGKSNISLTKTCSSCGQQKPLSAFLELTGSQGTTYGNICASCRKSHIEKLNQPAEPEESTTSTTGLKIDAKVKVKGEIDKRELFKQTEEQYLEEREKQEDKQLKHEQKVEHVAEDEKKHRKDFIEKRSFLDSSNKPSVTPTKVFGSEAQKAEAGKVDFTKDTSNLMRVAGTTRTQSTVFKSFQTWLGKGTHQIVTAAEKAAKQQNNKNTAEKEAMEPLNEHVNKNYTPRSK